MLRLLTGVDGDPVSVLLVKEQLYGLKEKVIVTLSLCVRGEKVQRVVTLTYCTHSVEWRLEINVQHTKYVYLPQ